MNKKYALYAGGGLLVLYLLYRWYAGQQAAASTGTAATGGQDTTGTTASQEANDYANLAGMIQQDEANIATLSDAQQAAAAAAATATGTTVASTPVDSTADTYLAAILSGQAAQSSALTQALQNLAAPAPSNVAPVVNVYTAAPSNSTPNPSSGGAVAPATHAPSGTPKMSALTAAEKALGYVAAPFGGSRPVAKAGYNVLGLGSGNWAYVPIPAKVTKAAQGVAGPRK